MNTTLKTLKIVSIGKILKTRGLKGELKIELFTDNPQQRFAIGNEVIIKNQPYKIKSFSAQNDKTFIRLESIDTIEQAEPLVGNKIFFDITNEPIGRDGYYRDDLLGFKVFNLEQREIGVVSDLIILPIQSRVEITTKDKDTQQEIKVQIPLVDEFVKKIDPEQKTIIVDRFNEFLEI